MVESSLKAIEKLIDGAQLFFHSRSRHLDHPLTELYDKFYQQQQPDEIDYQSISQNGKKSIDQFISSISSDLSEDCTRHANFLPIFDERYSECTTQEPKHVIGILIVNHHHNHAEWIELKRKLTDSAIPLLQEACYTDQTFAKNDLERNFFASLVGLNRIAPGEVVDKFTRHREKAKPIFAMGAKILHQSFAPDVKLCAIFDASSVRYISSTGSSTKKSFAFSELNKSKNEDSDRESDENGIEGYLASPSSSSMQGGMFAKNPFEHSKSFGSIGRSSVTSSVESNDTPDPFNSTNNLNDFVYTTEGQVMCEQSKQNVTLLGLFGDKSEAYDNLDGNLLRRVMAEYYASIRQTGSISKVHCETGDFSEDDEKNVQLRKALQVTEKDDLILSAPCFDNTGQPSFMIILVAQKKSFIYDDFRRQMIELIGISLSNSLLHIRAEELAQAQNVFTQKVQHELRTPLHGILGVNEAIMHTLRHAQDRGQDSAAEDQITEVQDPLLTELVSYSQSINDSADILSALVDDLVDFSIPFSRLDDTADDASSKLQRARDRRVIPLKVVFSALSSTCEKRWQVEASNRLDSTGSLPELFFWVDPLFQTRDISLKVDLDALHRVLVKLIANALEATTEGIIHVEVCLEDIQSDRATQMMPLDHAEIEFTKKYGKSYKHILTMTVRDSGHGMSKDFLSNQIFQAYQKENVDSPGIGLSLAFSRMTIEQMGGHIVADSEVGVGTTMKIALPVLLSEKKANIPMDAHRGSNASQLTAIPNLSAVFIGCKHSKSLSTLQCLLVDKLDGVIDGTDKINHRKNDKIDVLCIFPDGLQDCELNSWLSSERLAKDTDNEIPLTIIFSNGQGKNETEIDHSEFLNRIYSLSREVKEIQRPLGYKELQELILWIRQCYLETSRISIESFRGEIQDSSSSSSEEIDKGKLEDMEEQVSDEISTPLKDSIDDEFAGIALAPLPPFKVLLVEDNQVNAKIVTAFLRRTKIDFIEAKDGEEGVELFKRDLPAVILLDINMPKMNGFDAAIAMRAHPSPYKHHIAALTALSSEADRLRGFKVGMDAWYTKPLRMANLMEEIRKLREVYESTS
ncbi:hypothetical protein L7F22_067873 [Adiantum nelumboides]|nr:hypothetical protein [Adiantum nelumboides]